MKSLQEFLMESVNSNPDFARAIIRAIIPEYIKVMRDVADNFSFEGEWLEDFSHHFRGDFVVDTSNYREIEKYVKEYFEINAKAMETAFADLDKYLTKDGAEILLKLGSKSPVNRWGNEKFWLWGFEYDDWSLLKNPKISKLKQIDKSIQTINPEFPSAHNFAEWWYMGKYYQEAKVDFEYGTLVLQLSKAAISITGVRVLINSYNPNKMARAQR